MIGAGQIRLRVLEPLEKAVAFKDFSDLFVLCLVWQKCWLSACADRCILQVEGALDHRRGKAECIEVGPKGSKGCLLLLRFDNVAGIEGLQDTCKHIRHGVAEARDAASRTILQCPEHEMIGAGVDFETIDLVGNLQIGFQSFFRAAGILDAGNVAVAGERAPSSCDMVPVAGLLHPTMSNGQQGTEKTERIGRRLIFVDDCDPLARRFQIG